MLLKGPQIRAARALIGWSAADLSQHSSVSLRTIRRAELAERQLTLTAANNLAIRRALEAAGVEFTNGDQPGVRLSKAATRQTAQRSAKSEVNPVRKKARRTTAVSGKKH